MSIKLGTVITSAAKWLIKVNVEASVTVGRVPENKDPGPSKSTVSPAWAKRDSPDASDRGDVSETPQRVTLSGEAQQGMLQVTQLEEDLETRGGIIRSKA